MKDMYNTSTMRIVATCTKLGGHIAGATRHMGRVSHCLAFVDLSVHQSKPLGGGAGRRGVDLSGVLGGAASQN